MREPALDKRYFIIAQSITVAAARRSFETSSFLTDDVIHQVWYQHCIHRCTKNNRFDASGRITVA
jgi:hypothetical protein